VTIDITQRAGVRQATGTFAIEARDKTVTIAATAIGVLQSTGGWSSVTGITGGRAFTAIVDRRDPRAPGMAAVVVTIEGETPWRGTVPLAAVSTR
jgi:hypothetical protein